MIYVAHFVSVWFFHSVWLQVKFPKEEEQLVVFNTQKTLISPSFFEFKTIKENKYQSTLQDQSIPTVHGPWYSSVWEWVTPAGTLSIALHMRASVHRVTPTVVDLDNQLVFWGVVLQFVAPLCSQFNVRSLIFRRIPQHLKKPSAGERFRKVGVQFQNLFLSLKHASHRTSQTCSSKPIWTVSLFEPLLLELSEMTPFRCIVPLFCIHSAQNSHFCPLIAAVASSVGEAVEYRCPSTNERSCPVDNCAFVNRANVEACRLGCFGDHDCVGRTSLCCPNDCGIFHCRPAIGTNLYMSHKKK